MSEGSLLTRLLVTIATDSLYLPAWALISAVVSYTAIKFVYVIG